MKQKKQNKVNFLESLILGMIPAALGKTLFAPLERITIIIQTQESNENILQSDKKYSGLFSTTKNLIKQEGLKALWKGNLINVLRYIPNSCTTFAFNSQFQKYFYSNLNKETSIKNHAFGKIAIGGLSAAIALTFFYPLDFIRIRLSADVKVKDKGSKFTGLGDLIKTIYKTEGFKGFYKGYGSSLVYFVPYRGLYFGFYDIGKSLFPSIDSNITSKLVLATIVTLNANVWTYPLDVVRKRLTMQSGKSAQNVQYKNFIDCFFKMYKNEGVKSFFKGNVCNMYRCLGTAFVIFFYDVLDTWYQKNFKSH